MEISKQDRRIQHTKRFLHEALLRLMAKKPIGKITPTELCKEADINRNTFYSHYSSPTDLLYEIEEELYSEIIEYVTVFSEETIKVSGICKAIKDHADLCRVIVSDYGDRDFLLRLIASVHDITISEWKRYAPNVSDEELESYFVYCANGCVAVIGEWVKGGMKTSYEEIAKILENANSSLFKALQSK